MIKRGIRKIHAYISPSYMQFVFLLFVIVTTSLGYLAFLYNRDMREVLVQKQLQDRELVTARSGAKAIEFYLDNLQQDIVTLNQIPAIQSLNIAETQDIYKEHLSYIDEAPAVAIFRIDKSGKMVVLVNREGNLEGKGQNFSDREYFQWASSPSNRGKVYITQPFISRAGVSKGTNIIIVITPTYWNNQYTGLIGITVSLDLFTKQFVESLSIYDDGRVYLVNSEGNFIGGDQRLINRNLFSYAEERKWDGWEEFTANFKDALGKQEGQITWNFEYPGEKVESKMVAYHGVDLANQHYVLFVTNTGGLVGNFTRVLSSVDIFTVVLISIITLISGVFIFLLGNVSYRSGYLQGMERALERHREEKKK